MYQFALHAIVKCTEIANLVTECQISQLCVSKEDDKKHDGKSQDIFSTLDSNN